MEANTHTDSSKLLVLSREAHLKKRDQKTVFSKKYDITRLLRDGLFGKMAVSWLFFTFCSFLYILAV
ncbi:DUF3328 superfamily domain-containing protein [Histoplasma capsulatum var. duboisii H88]|uniref:DUF3328 superfamily domain-containing protein n=1 Tax=Ajellomyces capsulatus (strain H88) TaxID=544711 RepID=A0A8A1LW07_AJEC8|nr:DUF3328 superfamily domain-containing protein [Histoplasma capsulatum var. duboisii H88]